LVRFVDLEQERTKAEQRHRSPVPSAPASLFLPPELCSVATSSYYLQCSCPMIIRDVVNLARHTPFSRHPASVDPVQHPLRRRYTRTFGIPDLLIHPSVRFLIDLAQNPQVTICRALFAMANLYSAATMLTRSRTPTSSISACANIGDAASISGTKFAIRPPGSAMRRARRARKCVVPSTPALVTSEAACRLSLVGTASGHRVLTPPHPAGALRMACTGAASHACKK